MTIHSSESGVFDAFKIRQQDKSDIKNALFAVFDVAKRQFSAIFHVLSIDQ